MFGTRIRSAAVRCSSRAISVSFAGTWARPSRCTCELLRAHHFNIARPQRIGLGDRHTQVINSLGGPHIDYVSSTESDCDLTNTASDHQHLPHSVVTHPIHKHAIPLDTPSYCIRLAHCPIARASASSLHTQHNQHQLLGTQGGNRQVLTAQHPVRTSKSTPHPITAHARNMTSSTAAPLCRLDSPQFREILTPELLQIGEVLNASGFEVRLVGGVVRDLLLGNAPKDIDLATPATPEEVS